MSDETKIISVQDYCLDANKEFIAVEFEQNINGFSKSRIVFLPVDEVDQHLESSTGTYGPKDRLREIWQYDDNPTFRHLKEDLGDFFEMYLEGYLNITYLKAQQANYDRILEGKEEKIARAIRDIGGLKAMLELIISTSQSNNATARLFIDKVEQKYSSNTLKAERRAS